MRPPLCGPCWGASNRSASSPQGPWRQPLCLNSIGLCSRSLDPLCGWLHVAGGCLPACSPQGSGGQPWCPGALGRIRLCSWQLRVSLMVQSRVARWGHVRGSMAVCSRCGRLRLCSGYMFGGSVGSALAPGRGLWGPPILCCLQVYMLRSACIEDLLT